MRTSTSCAKRKVIEMQLSASAQSGIFQKIISIKNELKNLAEFQE